MVHKHQGFNVVSTPIPSQPKEKKKDSIAFRVLFWIGCAVLFAGAFGWPISLLILLVVGIVETIKFVTHLQSRLKAVEESTRNRT